MQRRIQGLRDECKLIEAQIAVYQSGDHREFDLLPGSPKKVDVTELFIVHLKDLLAAKRKFIQILEARLAKGT